MSLRHLAPIVFACCGLAHAQQPIGTILLEDATLTGNLSVANGRAVLVGSSNITAKDHAAQLILARRGSVSVCATSGLHVMQSQTAAHSLVLALDRGAIELHTPAVAGDLVLTPDLRFNLKADGPLDLRLRVTRNGDTCVENRGANAPVLSVTDAFTDAVYEVHQGQHVMFEHGSLKEVVDNESSPCGCPPPASPLPGATTADLHPFPAAVSQGLAPPPPVPQSAPGVANAQVSAQLGFSGDGSGNIAGTPVPVAAQSPPAPATVPERAGFRHRLGHFFKRIFGG